MEESDSASSQQHSIGNPCFLVNTLNAAVHDVLRRSYTKVDRVVVTNPGHYRLVVTAELKIHCLALNATLKYKNFGFDDQEQEQEFGVFRELISKCLPDLPDSENVDADAALRKLNRLVDSPESKVLSPTFHRLLHKAMQEVFESLLQELVKLGAIIVFANFSKIIIGTGRFDLAAAKSRCYSFLEAIKSRDQFKWIEIEPLELWSSLLFIDQHNYCGIPEKEAYNFEIDKSFLEKKNDKSSKTKDVWSICEYLPKAIKKHFDEIISDYVCWNYRYAKLFGSGMMKHIISEIISYLVPIVLTRIKDINSQEMGEFNQTVVSLRQLMHAVHRDRGCAALELIKNVCGVLTFDRRVEDEVWIVRKNLLKYIHAKEFAPESVFHYHACQSFILPNVICRHCYYWRDLDLCCCMDLLTKEWCCPEVKCGKPYDRDEMENTLMLIVNERMRLYYQQDLVCTPCKLVAKSLFCEHCKRCGGPLSCKEDAREICREMRCISMIASFEKFQVLKETIKCILQGLGMEEV